MWYALGCPGKPMEVTALTALCAMQPVCSQAGDRDAGGAAKSGRGAVTQHLIAPLWRLQAMRLCQRGGQPTLVSCELLEPPYAKSVMSAAILDITHTTKCLPFEQESIAWRYQAVPSVRTEVVGHALGTCIRLQYYGEMLVVKDAAGCRARSWPRHGSACCGMR